jgi:glycosyltransferase involved in cell wall biosynthesis
MPRVSVIVPVYNGENTIEDCVQSIFDLSFPRDEVELLLIDNDSTDGTAAILDRFPDRAKILSETTRGPSAARNRGLANATGDIIAFTDADCTVHPDWLTHLIEPLADKAVGISGGTILSRRPCNSIEAFGERIHDHRLAIEYDSPPYAITMNWASPRSVLEQVGWFDEELLRCEDCDLSYRILAAGYRIAYAPDAIIYHRNEETLEGLAAEGYAHGYHAVPLVRKHDEFIRSFSAKVPARPRPVIESDAAYWDVFRKAKTAGKEAALARVLVSPDSHRA